jgi:glutamyl-tRNA reductase
MYLSMIGIDHSTAPVDIRAKYAFTKKEAREALTQICTQKGIYGCVLLSTCNRLELWVSKEDKCSLSLYEWLCSCKNVPQGEDKDSFTFREGRPAVEHLFTLAAGLKSQIFGEDQILTQVKDALVMAREEKTADGLLEVLFRMAITAGKKIRTEIPFSHGNPSVIHKAITYLSDQGEDVAGKTCLVIGNGEMGKTAAQALREAGADVTVTVRQYRSGVVQIPVGCKRINYGERMQYLSECDLVVSATSSPNYTLTRELMEGVDRKDNLILMDLAVPRDMEPALADLPGVTLYDMDTFKTTLSSEQMKNIEEAQAIVAEQVEEFLKWQDGRELMPVIQNVKTAAARDLNARLEKPLRAVCDEEYEKVEKMLQKSTEKMLNKLIFGLRDQVSPDVFAACVAGMEKVYDENETLFSTVCGSV